MGSLAQIEKVLFLQGVEVFSYCSASQILRIASIAHEQRFSSGEEVFCLNDAADSIYCIVEGTVKLENAFNESAIVEQNALDRVAPDFVAEIAEGASDSRVSPTRVVTGYSDDQLLDLRRSLWASSAAGEAAIVLLGDQPAVPSKQRVWRHQPGDLE